ncbi:hypothetical protein SISSUDRAFT_1054121 [Sistotremastrum suecicum HHB10207 ss-3]|uniref:MYND-type domain-containing protein n=1 Tax=Sistotremastrum suecicum HHB10207 ss-3 TaxID=1314776 RepID=A0A165YRS0_9AGAM|nr:hypothetical protein SISSUDRAFT_1054121 [Sistotremastrum suecicum HHB10207 ss-3]
MSDLVNECNGVASPISWDSMGKIVCRHLNIAIYTRHDLKEIHRTKSAGKVVRALVECAREHHEDTNVIGGILSVIREMLNDAVLGQEICDKKLYLYIGRSLDLSPENSHFQRLVVDVLFDLIEKAPLPMIETNNQALKTMPKVVRVISRFSTDSDSETLHSCLRLLRSSLFKLNSYEIISDLPLSQRHPRPNLAEVAAVVVEVLESSSASSRLQWNTLNDATCILTWIAYYDSDAILQIPWNKGTLLFVCLLSSPSWTIRCRAWMGLLNIHYPDHLIPTRLCNPHLTLQMKGYPHISERVENDRESHPETVLSHDEITTRYHQTTVKHLPTGEVFNAYEAALRCVRFEREGPRDEAESYAYPYMRIFGLRAEPTLDLITDMDIALRFHYKDCEADILKSSVSTRLFSDSMDGGGDTSLPTIWKVYSESRIIALNALERWPRNSYFHYNLMKSHSGPEELELFGKAQRCGEDTMYLNVQRVYEMSLNFFNMGITFGALAHEGTQYKDFGEENLKNALPSFNAIWKACMKFSPQQHIAIICMTILVLITQNPDKLGSAGLQPWLTSFKKLTGILNSKNWRHYRELRRAVSDVLEYRKEAQRVWALLITEMSRMNLSAAETESLKTEVGLGPRQDAERPSRHSTQATDGTLPPFRSLFADPPEIPSDACAWCNRESVGLMKCAVCRRVKYCGKNWCVRLSFPMERNSGQVRKFGCFATPPLLPCHCRSRMSESGPVPPDTPFNAQPRIRILLECAPRMPISRQALYVKRQSILFMPAFYTCHIYHIYGRCIRD